MIENTLMSKNMNYKLIPALLLPREGLIKCYDLMLIFCQNIFIIDLLPISLSLFKREIRVSSIYFGQI